MLTFRSAFALYALKDGKSLDSDSVDDNVLALELASSWYSEGSRWTACSSSTLASSRVSDELWTSAVCRNFFRGGWLRAGRARGEAFLSSWELSPSDAAWSKRRRGNAESVSTSPPRAAALTTICRFREDLFSSLLFESTSCFAEGVPPKLWWRTTGGGYSMVLSWSGPSSDWACSFLKRTRLWSAVASGEGDLGFGPSLSSTGARLVENGEPRPCGLGVN